MEQTVHGRFHDIGIPIRVVRHHCNGTPTHIGGQMHSHDFTELIIVESGGGTHCVDGRDYPFVPGDVFVVHNQSHAIRDCRDMHWAEVMYNPSRFRLPMAHLRKLPGYHALFVLEPRRRREGHFKAHLQLGPTKLGEALQLVAAMRREFEARSPGYEAVLMARLIELLVMLSREYSSASAGEAKSLLRVGQVISALERDCRRAWRLEELCEISRLSKSSLSVLFRDATGYTPIEYLIRVRLRLAMQLLQTTDRPITEIAFDVGFADSNYLARQFKRIVGVSPTTYRKSAV